MRLVPVHTDNDPRFRTADGVLIVDGLKVWDYDLRLSRVEFAESFARLNGYWDGWFSMTYPDGSRAPIMNGVRMTTVHPSSRNTAESQWPKPDTTTIVRRIVQDANGWVGQRGSGGQLAYNADGSGGQWYSDNVSLPATVFVVPVPDAPLTVDEVEAQLREWGNRE